MAGTAAEEGLDLGHTLSALEEKDLVITNPRSRLSGEREYAFKHVLIRDVAYGMLPKAVRCRKHVEVGEFIRDRAGDRIDAFVGLVAEHYTRAAALGSDGGLDPAELAELRAEALALLESAGDAAAALYSNAEAFERYSAALELSDELDPGDRARIGEKQGDVALRMGRVDAAVAVWERCLEHHRSEEDLARVADLHRKIGAALWHKGERRASIDNYQRGIDLLKDGPPCIELVRLYEEAASLYMHTGDNMLAIYASEKALRLAERLDEARAASRAHGIFGRVFGRIGDSEKARENLERSVALARESDRGEAVRALLTLGYHLEISEADYDGAAEAYREALKLAQEVGDLPSQVELHASLGQLAAEQADWEEVERATEASGGLAEREGLHGKLCFPFLLRGVLAWRLGNWDESTKLFRRAHELGEQVGRSEVAFSALQWLAWNLRESGDLGGCRNRARQGAGHLRARRADRPVGRGDRGARRRPGAGRPHGPGPRRRRGGRAPRGPAALPRGRGRQGRGRGRLRRGSLGGRRADGHRPRALERAWAPPRRSALHARAGTDAGQERPGRRGRPAERGRLRVRESGRAGARRASTGAGRLGARWPPPGNSRA